MGDLAGERTVQVDSHRPYRELSDLSRRDERTKPGVLTPGTRPHNDRLPEGAADICDRRLVWLTSDTPEAPVLPPLWAGRLLIRAPGVKTPG